MQNDSEIKLFALSSNEELGNEISSNLDIPISSSSVSRFSDGEINIKINESIRGCDVFIIQSTSNPVNENIMELLIMVDALKRASANTINVIIPYFGYARQDKKSSSRKPITSKLVANLLQISGVSRVLTIDLHAPQIQGFFDIPVDSLSGVFALSQYFRQISNKNFVAVSPNNNGITRARKLAENLNIPLAVIDKRNFNNDFKVKVVGEVQGKDIIIIDDVVGTAETVEIVSKKLKEEGAKSIFACCTHPVLSSGFIEVLERSDIEEFVTTNSIPVFKNTKENKIKIVSIAPLISDAIKRVSKNVSVSDLFE